MNEEINNRVQALVSDPNAAAVLSVLSGTQVGAIPLQPGDVITIRLREGEGLNNIFRAAAFNGFNFVMVRHDCGEIGASQLFRRNNGLPYTVDGIDNMRNEFLGWMLDRGGVLVLRIVAVRQREAKTYIKQFFVFEIVNAPVAVAQTDTEDDEEPEENTDTPQTDTPQTDTPQTDTPQTDTPQTDTPQTDTPQTDTPQTDTPQTENA